MKKFTSKTRYIILGVFLGFIVAGCATKPSEKAPKNEEDINEEITDLFEIDEEDDFVFSGSPKAPIQLTEKEMRREIDAFLKENRSKHEEIGEVEDEYEMIMGDYLGTNGTDCFLTVWIFPGGDFFYPLHYFYRSDIGEFVELDYKEEIDMLFNVSVNEIKENKMKGKAFLLYAMSGEHFVLEDFNVEFKIIDNEIVFNESFDAGYKRAKKEMEPKIAKVAKEIGINDWHWNYWEE